MVAKGTFSKDVGSSASVARKAVRTLASSRREARTSGVTSWRKMISGDFGPSRIWQRMSLARETAREEKASTFHDIRENLCATWVTATPRASRRHWRPHSGGGVENRMTKPASIDGHGGVLESGKLLAGV